MKPTGGFMNRFRSRKIWRVILALGSLFLLLSSLRARADTCGAGVECEEAAPLDRGFVSRVVGEPAGRPLQGEELRLKTHELGLLLRCPTCQGSSVSDSPSSTALNMRQEVSDLLAEGYTSEQILSYFEAAYGQFVLLEPKAEGFTLLVWVAPGALLLLGIGFLFIYFRRPQEATASESAAAAPSLTPALGEVEEELRPWIEQVRALAYGDSSGGSTPGGGS